jgi:hypothetical protein
MKRWKPRSSSLAGYMYCTARAAYDRALAVGDLEPAPAGERDTKYADLGSLIHLAMQVKMGCVFDTPTEPCPLEMNVSAAKLFGDDQHRLQRAIDAATAAGLSAMPKAPDGLPWRAEVRATSPYLSGHIDFLSQDGTTLIDLKTTSRKPDHNRVKGEHFLQMLAYKMLVPTITRAHILYVDSQQARWTLLSPPIDFSPGSEAEAQLPRLLQFLKRIRSVKIYDTAIAAPGGHCSGCFCPHTAICKDKLIPAAGVVVDTTPLSITPPVQEIFP